MKIGQFACLFAAVIFVTGCGAPKAASRIKIKHATDPEAAQINRTPIDITVEDLIATKLPESFKGKLEDYTEQRIGDFEKSTFRVHGKLKSVVHKKDGDYFLVMEGKTGATAVIEVPDPKLAPESPLIKDMTATRNMIESKYHPTDKEKEINEEATIEGVGFYGFRSKQGAGGSGSAPRLMPGTNFSQEKS